MHRSSGSPLCTLKAMVDLSDFMSDSVHLDFVLMATPLLQTLSITASLCRLARNGILSIVKTLNCIIFCNLGFLHSAIPLVMGPYKIYYFSLHMRKNTQFRQMIECQQHYIIHFKTFTCGATTKII